MSDELGLELVVHPAHLVDADDLAVLALWRAWRGTVGALGGSGGPLPFAGGAADQPACVMAAFRVMDRAWAALHPPKKGANDE